MGCSTMFSGTVLEVNLLKKNINQEMLRED